MKESIDNETVNSAVSEMNGFNTGTVIVAPPDGCPECLERNVPPEHSILVTPSDTCLLVVKTSNGAYRELEPEETMIWGHYRCPKCHHDWTCYWRMEALGE